MNVVKTEFSIKDLENLSKVKAHTIRIWEKRYNLLEPERTDTNIRKYDLESLKKLLNITYLYHAGHKISKLAKMDAKQVERLIHSSQHQSNSDYALEIFKTVMLEFNGALFDSTLQDLLKTRSFRQIFTDVFVPLLTETGILWHSGSIDPSHEHFISEKIKHAIVFQTEKIKKDRPHPNKPSFVLYLPEKEIHEIGLLYANYELLKNNFNTIYLGPNVPLKSLKHVMTQKSNLQFLTYFTVSPEIGNIDYYIQDFEEKFCTNTTHDLWILGRRSDENLQTKENIKFFLDVNSFEQALNNLDNKTISK